MCVFKKYLVQCRHLGSFIQQQFNYLDVPHFCGFDKRSLSLLKQKVTRFFNTILKFILIPKPIHNSFSERKKAESSGSQYFYLTVGTMTTRN